MKITNSIFVVFLTSVVRGFAPNVLFTRDTKRKSFDMIDAFLEMENSVKPKWLTHNIDHLSFTPLNISTSEDLHLFSSKTPTSWAVMSEGNVASWAASQPTQNGVKWGGLKHHGQIIVVQ